VVERARRLDERRVERPQRRPGSQKDVRVGVQRDHEHRSRKPVHVREPLDAERGEDVVELAAGPERGDERERPDVAGNDERKRDRDRKEPPEGEIGTDGEVRQRDAEQDRRPGDAGHQQEAVDHDLDGPTAEQQLSGPGRLDGNGLEHEPDDRDGERRRDRRREQRQSRRRSFITEEARGDLISRSHDR